MTISTSWHAPPLRSRVAALAVTGGSFVVNFLLCKKVLSYWSVLKWEADTEWEVPTEGWNIDGVKFIWALLFFYFSVATVVSGAGFVGVVKHSLPLTRFYRDYSIADLCVSSFATILLTLASFQQSARSTICEEVALQPDLLRELDLSESGLNPENCEQWFQHAVVALISIVAVILVVRLQFILTLTSFYKHLLRHRLFDHTLNGSDSDLLLDSAEHFSNSERHATHERSPDDHAPRRIYLLPPRPRSSSKSASDTPSSPTSQSITDTRGSDCAVDDMLVYAPIPLESLSPAEARELVATETWVTSPTSQTFALSHAHPRRHHHRRTGSQTQIQTSSTSLSSTTCPNQRRTHSRSNTISISYQGAREEGRRNGNSSNSRRARSSSFGKGGEIRLPSSPNEGLLPTYAEVAVGENEGTKA